MNVVEDIKAIIGDTLGIGDRAMRLSADSELLGSVPEFDSMAVVSVLTAVEEHYDIEIEDDEVDAEIFATVGTLAEFVSGKIME